MDDGTGNLSDYPSSGDIPEFRLYDNSTNTVYSTNSNPDIPPIYNNDFIIIEELFSIPLSVDEISLPTIFNISDIYPNPFNAATTLHYDLPEPSSVKITIFDILGRTVVQLVNQKQHFGYKKIVWNGKNSAGNLVAPGIYLYKAELGSHVEMKKMILIK